jgi:outer membrane murein-binding lipoprotein Lpp
MGNMLTKEDLLQIRDLIRTELQPLKADIQVLKIDVKALKSDVATLRSDVAKLKLDMRKVRRDINIIVSSFDSDYVELRTRVERIETHLNLSS